VCNRAPPPFDPLKTEINYGVCKNDVRGICVCVCIYVCVRVCIYVHTHTHTHTHIYIYIYLIENSECFHYKDESVNAV